MSSGDNNTVYGHSSIRGLIHGVLVATIALFRSATMIFGTISMLLIDIALGAATLTLLITHSPEVSLIVKTIHIPAATIGTAFSAGTSAVQLAMWDSVLRGKKHTHGVWAMLALLITVDTLLDVASVGWLMYGQLSQSIVVSSPRLDLYWVVVVLVGLMAACDSYYINVLIQHLSDDGDEADGSDGAPRARRSFGQVWRDMRTSRPGN